jgi:hypothetical protein
MPSAQQNQVDAILIVSFDYKGVVHHSHALQGQIINQYFCLQMLKHAHGTVHCKWPQY